MNIKVFAEERSLILIAKIVWGVSDGPPFKGQFTEDQVGVKFFDKGLFSVLNSICIDQCNQQQLHDVTM